jgi:hypothetical protein
MLWCTAPQAVLNIKEERKILTEFSKIEIDISSVPRPQLESKLSLGPALKF